MNAFNRLAMVLVLLGMAGAIALSILLLLLAPQLMGAPLANIGKTLGSRGEDPNLGRLQLELTVVGLVLFIPVMVLLWLEVRPTARDSIRLTKVGSADVRLSMHAVAQSLVYHVDALPGVVRVRPRLNADDKGVGVRLDVETHPDVDVRTKTDEIARTAKSVIEERLGLTLKNLQIQLHHAPYPRGVPVRAGAIEAPRSPAPPAVVAPPAPTKSGDSQTL